MRAIDRLGVVGNVLYVAAHPDDENTRLLAWLANEKLVRTGYLSLTRGDGGQNLIGAEQAPLLGLIRTEELLAARAIDGAEQCFTRARDFGYSKTPDETLRIWDHDAIARRRGVGDPQFQPDVIITRFPPEGARDARPPHRLGDAGGRGVQAAADRRRPEQPKRVAVAGALQLRRAAAGGRRADVSCSKLDVGGYNPLLGLSYGEMAAQSRSMHKSQGFGVAPSRGEQAEYFRVLAGEPTTHSIFDGIDLTWARVPGGKKIGEHVARSARRSRRRRRRAASPSWSALRGEMQALRRSSVEGREAGRARRGDRRLRRAVRRGRRRRHDRRSRAATWRSRSPRSTARRRR